MNDQVHTAEKAPRMFRCACGFECGEMHSLAQWEAARTTCPVAPPERDGLHFMKEVSR